MARMFCEKGFKKNAKEENKLEKKLKCKMLGRKIQLNQKCGREK